MSYNRDPKNLILIMSDQHNRAMLGSYGNEKIQTPNLDSLAKNGVRFPNAYCNNPLCVPSRSSMVTGQYSHVHGYWDNAHAYGGGEDSFGEVLHRNGHTAVTIGKLHLFNDSPATGFHDQRIPLHIVEEKGDIYGCIRDKEITRPNFLQTLLNAGPGESDYTRYDRAIAQRAKQFLLEEAKGQDKPFVLYLGFVAPHFPLIVPQEFFDLYINEELMPLVESDPREWTRHPVLDDYRRYCEMETLTAEQMHRGLAAYYGLCTFLDTQVGIVLDALKESGLADQTRIIYTSDHGDSMGEHGLFYKSTMYEGSVGVPMILAGPDIPAGVTNNSLVSLVDLFPTVLDGVGLADESQVEELPGDSLLQIIDNPAMQNRPVFSEYHSFGSYTSQYMLRLGQFKYIYYVDEPAQLFDLENDPGEKNNLATDSCYASVLSHLEGALRTIGDPDEISRRARESQDALLASYGGKEMFLKNFKPYLFSPIPDLD